MAQNLSLIDKHIISKENFPNFFLMKTTHQKLKFQKMVREFFLCSYFFSSRLRKKFFERFEKLESFNSIKLFLRIL